MRRILLLALLASAGCNDSDDDGGGATAFAPVVTDLIRNRTNESGEPIETNGTTFSFPTDEGAFDALLPPDTGTVVE